METNSSGAPDDVMSEHTGAEAKINVGLFGGLNTGFSAPVNTPRESTKRVVEETLSAKTPEQLKAEAMVHVGHGNIDAATECYDKWIEIDPVEGRINKGIMLAVFDPINYFQGIGEIAQAAAISINDKSLMVLFNTLKYGHSNLAFKKTDLKFKNVSREQILNEINLYLSSQGNKTLQKEIAGRLYIMLLAYSDSAKGQ